LYLPTPSVLNPSPAKMIIAPWGLTVKPGAMYKYEIPPFANLKISNAALGAELEDDRSRTTLTIETEDRSIADSEDEELDEDEDKSQPTNIVLTSLTPGKVGKLLVDCFYIQLHVFCHRLSSRFMTSRFLSLLC